MSTSRDPTRAEDRLIGVLSRWLARDIPNERLRQQIEEIGSEGLTRDEADAVEEVRAALADSTGRAHVDRLVRETIEFLALGS